MLLPGDSLLPFGLGIRPVHPLARSSLEPLFLLLVPGVDPRFPAAESMGPSSPLKSSKRFTESRS